LLDGAQPLAYNRAQDVTAPPRPPRTLVASVLFVDLVDFSEKSVAEQIQSKRELTRVLRRILSSISADDYRLMDTGDGAALGFIADPEHALYFALAIDTACREAPPSTGLGPGVLRIGINLGPVKDVFDVNDRPNLIGDGMNTAQRIVGFAEPGQITMSRSFFELVSRLAPEYSGIFVHIGAHDDKHGREHDLYVIKPAKDMLGKIQERLQLVVAEATGINVVFAGISHVAGAPGRDTPPRPAAAPVSGLIASATHPVAPMSDVPKSPVPAPRGRLRSMAIIATVVVVAAIILTPLVTRKAAQHPAEVAHPSSTAPTRPDERVVSQPQSTASPTIPANNVAPVPSTTSAAPTTAAATSGPAATTNASSSPTSASTVPPQSGDATTGDDRSQGAASTDATATSSRQTATAPPGAASDRPSAKHVPRVPPVAKRSAAVDDNVDDASASSTSTKSASPATRGSYTRCSTLMQKATLGETLTPGDRREMEQFCR
jgi:class 3 adenylate cyclase